LFLLIIKKSRTVRASFYLFKLFKSLPAISGIK
jgi:hypothetical protein